MSIVFNDIDFILIVIYRLDRLDILVDVVENISEGYPL